MILIVDSNILFGAMLKNSTTRKLLIDSSFTLYAPETVLKEIQKYKQEIIKRADYSEQEFEILFNLITENIEIIEKEKYKKYLKEADDLIGQLDKGDVPFLALAMSMTCDGIWTENTRHFKQDKIKIWKTKELASSLQAGNNQNTNSQ